MGIADEAIEDGVGVGGIADQIEPASHGKIDTLIYLTLSQRRAWSSDAGQPSLSHFAFFRCAVIAIVRLRRCLHSS